VREWLAVTGGRKPATTSEAPYTRTQLVGA